MSETTLQVTIAGGTDKSGNAEPLKNFTAAPGDVVAIVGVTGSGKSRLLTDIEWLSAGDSPSGRRVTVSGSGTKSHGGDASSLVARLSQSMMYHLDMNVMDFLSSYADTREAGASKKTVEEVFEWANNMSGERFESDVRLCQLSGGQARALMIAETALLSGCDIILVDEIENAGIDRRRALELLTGAGKTTFLATHDPLLTLESSSRIVMKNGAMTTTLKTTDGEKKLLQELSELEDRIDTVRNGLRRGEQS